MDTQQYPKGKPFEFFTTDVNKDTTEYPWSTTPTSPATGQHGIRPSHPLWQANYPTAWAASGPLAVLGLPALAGWVPCERSGAEERGSAGGRKGSAGSRVSRTGTWQAGGTLHRTNTHIWCSVHAGPQHCSSVDAAPSPAEESAGGEFSTVAAWLFIRWPDKHCSKRLFVWLCSHTCSFVEPTHTGAGCKMTAEGTQAASATLCPSWALSHRTAGQPHTACCVHQELVKALPPLFSSLSLLSPPFHKERMDG